MNRIIVIDNGTIQFRAIFCYMKQTSTVPCTWTYLNMLTGYLNKLNVTLDDLIILAIDYGSWRKDIDKSYKAQRKEFKESFKEDSWWQQRYSEFNELFKKLDICLPIHQIKIWKTESDDILSASCRYYKDKKIILISSDKDIEQLAYFPNVSIFSPITKKFKNIPNPQKTLLDKMEKGDISDNILGKPQNEAEWEHRRQLVDLISPLPSSIENAIKEQFNKISPKNLNISKIPFNSIRLKFAKIYKLT
jgi:5'-3' exonuclease